jgi:hypothetical protein
MGQEAVNGILEGLKNAAQRYQFNQNLAVEQQRANSQKEQEQARIKQQQDELKQRTSEFNANHALAKAAADAYHLQVGNELARQAQQFGITPAGSSSGGAAPPSSGAPTPANPAMAGPPDVLNGLLRDGEFEMTSMLGGPPPPVSGNPGGMQSLSIPGLGENGGPLNVQYMSVADLAQRQAASAEIAAGPARKSEELKQQAETTRILATNKQAEEYNLKREALRVQGENWRNQQTLTNAYKVAMLPYGGALGQMPPEQRVALIQPSVDGMMNGDMSAKQVQTEFAAKGMAGLSTAVTNQFMSAGGIPPTDAQVKFKQGVQPIIDSLPLIQQYIQMLPPTSSWAGGKLAGISNALDTDLNAKMQEIDFNIATVAKTLGGDQGQRLQKALLAPAEGGYLPSKFKPTTANVANFNRLVDVVNSTVDTQLGSMPPAQRAHIKNLMKLTQISKLAATGKPVATPTSAAQPSQAPSTVHKYYDNQGNEVAAPMVH